MLKNDVKAHNKMVKSRTDFNKQHIDLTEPLLQKLKNDGVIKDYFYVVK